MSVIPLPTGEWHPERSTDEWGRDQHFITALGPLTRLRWNIDVGGTQHVPKRGAALLVCSSRRFALAPVFAALALSSATGRAVRFVGRPDTAPFGPLLQRLGGLLADPAEVAGALRAHQLVMLGTAPTASPRHAGNVEHTFIAAALASGSAVIPVAAISSPTSRAARVEVGAPIRVRVTRRGPLGAIELAETTQGHVQRLLDRLGGVHTGVAPLDWLAEG